MEEDTSLQWLDTFSDSWDIIDPFASFPETYPFATPSVEGLDTAEQQTPIMSLNDLPSTMLFTNFMNGLDCTMSDQEAVPEETLQVDINLESDLNYLFSDSQSPDWLNENFQVCLYI